MPAKRDQQRTKAYTALLAVAIIWGVTTPVIKYALKMVGPFTLLFFRLTLASAFILPFLWLEQKRQHFKVTGKQILTLAALGTLATTVTLSLFFLGFEYTTALDGAVISIIAPILIVLGGAIFLKENITKQEWLGTSLAIVGSLTIALEPVFSGRYGAESQLRLWGNLLIILANFSWVAYTLLSKKINGRHVPTLIQTGISFAAGSITSLPLAIWEQQRFWAQGKSLAILTLSFKPWLAIIYLAIFSSVLAYFLYEWSLKKIEASEATIFSYLQPIFTLPAAYLILGEWTNNPFFWVGCLLATVGVTITEWRWKSRQKKKSS